MLQFRTRFLIARIDWALDQGKIPSGLFRRWIDRDPKAAEYLRNMIELEDRLAADQFSYLNYDPLDSDLLGMPNAAENHNITQIAQGKILDENHRISLRSRLFLLAGAVMILLTVGIGFLYHVKFVQTARKQDPVIIQNHSLANSISLPFSSSPYSHLPASVPASKDSGFQLGIQSLKPEDWLESCPLLLVSPEISALLLNAISGPNSEYASFSPSFPDLSAVGDSTAPSQKESLASPNPVSHSGEAFIAADQSKIENNSEKTTKDSQEDLFQEIMNSNPFSAHLMEYYISPVFAAREVP